MASPKARAKPALLSGGNPQIAKADGDAPVRAYIAAMPAWKRDVGRRVDGLIARSVPGVKRAVRWNSPFYGVEGKGWFLAFHCFTRYIKVTFFKGTSLRPPLPGTSKHGEVRYLDIHEGGALDEKQLANWIKQAAAIPGWGGASGETSSKEARMKKPDASAGSSAAVLITERIAELGDWRGEALGRMRKLIKAADPKVVEEWKWGGPVWSHDGLICTGETYKKAVKLTFARGASLKDPKRLFTSSLEGKVRRAIDIPEGEKVDATAFKTLVRQAVAFNQSGKAAPAKKKKS